MLTFKGIPFLIYLKITVICKCSLKLFILLKILYRKLHIKMLKYKCYGRQDAFVCFPFNLKLAE